MDILVTNQSAQWTTNSHTELYCDVRVYLLSKETTHRYEYARHTLSEPPRLGLLLGAISINGRGALARSGNMSLAITLGPLISAARE